MANKKYQIIYADPPWQFKTYSVPKDGKKFRQDATTWRNPDVHYPCMSFEDLKHLPVTNIASDNCLLFMWATFPLLEQALELIKEWEFTYKTVALVWVKQNPSGLGFHFGLGYWTRANAEICLLATRGKPKRNDAGVSQLLISPVRKHSQKPAEARQKILKLCGDLPRIELFARQKVNGWDCWGNEVESDIKL